MKSASASRSCDGARGRDRRRGKIQKTKGGELARALTSVLSLTSVAVSVAISALVATARVTRLICVGGM